MKKTLILLFLFTYNIINSQGTFIDKKSAFKAVTTENKTPVYLTANTKSKIESYLNKNDTILVIGMSDNFIITKINKKLKFIPKKNIGDNFYIKNFIEINKIAKKAKEKKKEEKFIKECHYIRNEIDEFDKKRKIVTEIYNINQKNTKFTEYTELGIQLYKIHKENFIKIYSNQDLGCTSPYFHNKSSVKIKLTNQKTVTFLHSGDVECGNFEITGKLSNSEILLLKKYKIKTIRLSGIKFYHDIKDVFWDTFFIDKLNCIK